MMDFEKTDLGIDLIANAFRGSVQNTKDGFTYGPSIQYKMLLVRLHVYRSIKT